MYVCIYNYVDGQTDTDTHAHTRIEENTVMILSYTYLTVCTIHILLMMRHPKKEYSALKSYHQ